MKVAVHLTAPLTGMMLVVAAWGCHGMNQTPPARSPQPSPSSSAAPAPAHETGPRAIIQIDGMACPFCTYNIQRQLQALPGVERVDVSLDKGEAYVTLSEQDPATEAQLRDAVKSSGFTPRQVRMP